MKSIFDFIVEPAGQRYNNEVKVGDKSLIINTKIESFKSVNNIAKVIEIPISYKTPIKKGDLIMIHHNVFRRWYNIKGEEKNISWTASGSGSHSIAAEIEVAKGLPGILVCSTV